MRPMGPSRNVVRMLAATLVPEHLQQRSLRRTLQVESFYLLCLGQPIVSHLNVGSAVPAVKHQYVAPLMIRQQPSLVF